MTEPHDNRMSPSHKNIITLLLAGLGVAYVLAGHWSARLDYLRVEHAGLSITTDKYNAGILTVGASYSV